MLARALALCAVLLLPSGSNAQDLFLCTKVLDGDTIELESVGRVRLIGVNCPEPGERTNGVQGFAAEATEYTRSLVEGERVRLEYDRERRDKFQRTLAYVYLEDSSFVNALIVKMGYGSAYTRFPFRYSDRFRRLEQEARLAKRGMWGLGDDVGELSVGRTSGELESRSGGAVDETTVFVTRTGKKYHRDGCRSLARSKIPIALSEAVLRYGACGICSPPTLREGNGPDASEQNLRRDPSASAGRCQATTKKGTQCRRSARSGSSYCWQHGG